MMRGVHEPAKAVEQINARRYSSIEEEVKACGLKLGDLMSYGWHYAGISKSTGTHCAFYPRFSMLASASEAFRYFPDRVTFGYFDSIQRNVQDLKQRPENDDGGVRPMTIEESEDIINLPSAKEILVGKSGVVDFWVITPYGCYPYSKDKYVVRLSANFKSLEPRGVECRGAFVLPFRSDPRQRVSR